MKHTFIGSVIALVLALTLVIGAVALAENGSAEAPAVPEVQTEDAAAADEATALQEALKALNEARSSSRQDDLEAELNAFVEAGKLTREQADLILKYYKEQQALRDGVCPNCGYQFSTGRGTKGLGGKGSGRSSGRNGSMNNGRNGFGGRGGRGMMGGMPSTDAGSGASDNGASDSGSADGTAFSFGGMFTPDAPTGSI